MQTTTVYTTSDGRRWVDDEPGATAHQEKLSAIQEFLEWRKVPPGRAQSHDRNTLLAWLDWRAEPTWSAEQLEQVDGKAAEILSKMKKQEPDQ